MNDPVWPQCRAYAKKDNAPRVLADVLKTTLQTSVCQDPPKRACGSLQKYPAQSCSQRSTSIPLCYDVWGPLSEYSSGILRAGQIRMTKTWRNYAELKVDRSRSLISTEPFDSSVGEPIPRSPKLRRGTHPKQTRRHPIRGFPARPRASPWPGKGMQLSGKWKRQVEGNPTGILGGEIRSPAKRF